MIAPHGGALVARLTPPDELPEVLDRLPGLATIAVDRRTQADLELIAIGAVSPLTGFLSQDDYRSVVDDLHLTNGLPWTLPITLAVSDEQAAAVREGDYVSLVTAETRAPVAMLEVQQKYRYSKEGEAQSVYGTTSDAHPGVAALYRQGNVLLGGPVTVFRRQVEPLFCRYAFTPVETRAAFAARGWQTVVGFQTRNPVHRAHEYIQKAALEVVDGLLLHPLVGETKADDVPAAVRLRCYEVLLEHYYHPDRAMLGVMPAAMRYAGPREAVFHAIVRKNYGCSHFIVGRDHAGVGNFYGTYDAQRIFDRFDPALIGIQILKFEHTFYCRRCQGMASSKTCPHGDDDHVVLSGTRVRTMLRDGEDLPPEFSRPEVAEVLKEAFKVVV